MNEWVKKSIEIANAPGYLDKLSSVYRSKLLPRRPLDDTDKQEIESLHAKGDLAKLVPFLLGLTKKKHPFPIEHPYASLLRQRPELIKKNPRIFHELENILGSMPVEDIIKGCERRIDLNRVMGQEFQRWLKHYFSSKGIPFLSEIGFQSCSNVAFLDGKDRKILDYLNRRLGYDLERGRDFLYRIEDRFLVGEARFLSTAGGSQSRDLNETIQFIRSVRGTATAVGVLDGIIWFNNSYVNRLSDLGNDEPALTVLLLDEFLESFG